ncbi:MAG: polysaccharide deacetylase family protein [Deltaproteobacteria bacterium]|nr:polysaccharide deacetylase family protein [Deltaproteobacteria bacterium]
MKNGLTIDVEDWFHICDVEKYLPREKWDSFESRVKRNLEKILNFLSKKRISATFFVLGYVAKRDSEIVMMIANDGHEVASHGFSHLQVYKQGKEEFKKDIDNSINLLEEISGEKVKGFRAPEWSITRIKKGNSLWALDLLKEKGFLYDSSIAPVKIIGIHDSPTYPYQIETKSGKIWEFPPLVLKSPFGNIPVGGGWGFRTIPYKWIKRRIKELNNQRIPAIIYIHPWECDPNPPKIDIPLIKKMVISFKWEDTFTRLKRVIDDFEFTNIKDLILE